MSVHSNIFPCMCAAHGLKLESVLPRGSVHVGSEPGGEAQRTAVSIQQTVPQSAVFMSHRHGRVERRLCLCESIHFLGDSDQSSSILTLLSEKSLEA